MDSHNDIPVTFDFVSPEIVQELKNKKFIVKSFRHPHWFSVNQFLDWKGVPVERQDVFCILQTLRIDHKLDLTEQML